MSSDYGYINARIRAMKSFLLKEEDYLKSLTQNTLDAFISFLSSLPTYANDLYQVSLEQSAKLRCDEALKLNLCRIFRKIVRFCEGEPKRLILILLTHWDIYNLNTTIRGILSAQDKAQIMKALIPAGKWDLKFLNLLVEHKDLKELARGLAASEDNEPLELEKEFARLISDFSVNAPLPRTVMMRDLELLENSFKEIYFERALEYLKDGNSNARVVSDYLSLQIDFLNILLVIRTLPSSTKVKFIKGGRLTDKLLKELTLLKSPEDSLKKFADTDFSWLSQEGLDIYRRSQRLSSLERLLKNKLFSFCSRVYTHGDPLSLSIPLAFINFKENEISNLRLICKSILFGIPKDLIKEEIIFA